MNRRIIIKTMAICWGIFIITASTAAWLIFKDYRPDTEPRIRVLAAVVSIEAGTVINEGMLAYREVRLSDSNVHMVGRIRDATGKKAIQTIKEGDYVRNYDLLPRETWYGDGDRVTVLPADMEARLANLVKKGSYVDVRLAADGAARPPPLILAKARVEGVIDENGLEAGDSPGSRKAYIKLILSKEERDRVYAAEAAGRLVFELYCDPAQKKPDEEFNYVEP